MFAKFFDFFTIFTGKLDSSLDDNRMYGKYRVLYGDGEISQPMYRDVAKSYAKMFSGKVIPK